MEPDEMSGLLIVVGKSANFLVKDVAIQLFQQSVKQSFDFVDGLDEKQLKSQKIGYCYELLEALHCICASLWPNQVQQIGNLRLDMIIRMLKTPQFSSRMNALKELAKLIEDSEKLRSEYLDSDCIQEYMIEKRVLSLALEGKYSKFRI